MPRKSLTIAAVVVLVNVLLWSLSNRPDPPEPVFNGMINGMSFSPYREGQDPLKDIYPTHEQIRDDIHFLKDKTRTIRTYSSIDGMEVIPGLAAAQGFDVVAGAWLDHRPERNEKEIKNLIANGQRYRAIRKIIVGNEVILRGDMTVAQLIAQIKRVRKAVPNTPISTAEPWHVWVKNPQLVQHVDFIAIHVLPYWEKVPLETAVSWVFERYEEVKRAFPGKHVFIGEVGWPSAGARWGWAKPSSANQARFLRRFLTLAEQRGIDYCIMEAFDQPWKEPFEGIVGGFWGIFNLQRELKIPFEGPVRDTSFWIYQCLAGFVGLIPVAWFLRRNRARSFGSNLFFALMIQAIVMSLVWSAFAPITGEFLRGETVAWLLMMPFQLGLLAVVLINGYEMSEMLWIKDLKRRFAPVIRTLAADWPKVSIHLPICKEPPDMVIRTLNSLAELDYPDFEVLVVDNNNPHPELWQPVESHCRKLGDRFRFFHLETHPGYKAGALNFALDQTDANAQVVAVVDSDYVVRSQWLKELVPHFERPQVAIVQAPQDHREWEGDLFKTMINWEYHGFFEIGMVHRNERNAIIQHGTMTLIRRSVLEAVGRWGEWCICEDAELGLRIFQKGLEAVYVKDSYGRGLTPDSFAGYKRQRFRWVYGAVQILRQHWRTLLPWNASTQLNQGQRYHFWAGWLPWFGDAVNYMATWVCIYWTIGMILLPGYFGTPLHLFLWPVVGAFVFKLVHFLVLYQARVHCGPLQRLGAAVAGMALTHTIASAICKGIFSKNQPFLRTPKCEDRPALLRGLLMAKEELALLLLLWLSAANLFHIYRTSNLDILLFMAVIVILSIPYAAALFLSMASVMPHGFTLLLPRQTTVSQAR
jgi:exo-beta-1,3-glucanase (GH17 family)/cellulose synthase/poly-beta-1,6-N-acetylglucosamine synthase-like glycosyltransferase